MEEIISIIHKLFHKTEEKGIPSKLFHEDRITLIPKLDKNTTLKEKQRLVSLMSIDVKILK